MNLHQDLIRGFPNDQKLNEMTRYHLSTGGKCLRGQLASSESLRLGANPQQALTWAMACELLHNATLIHDDIQDNDPIRRGQPSLWKKYGIAQAINVGDFLIFRSFKLTASLHCPALSEFLADTSEELVLGQSIELGDPFPVSLQHWDRYTQQALLKTGTLFLLPIKGAFLLNGKTIPAEVETAWSQLGLYYQVYDDIRDFYGLKQQGQKQKDFVEKRLNAIIAWLSQDQDQHDLINRYFSCEAGSSTQRHIIAELNEVIESTELIEKIENFIKSGIAQFKNNTPVDSQKIILNYLNFNLEQRSQ